MTLELHPTCMSPCRKTGKSCESFRRRAGAPVGTSLLLVLTVLLPAGCSKGVDVSHPLDPLTEQEITSASRILAADGLVGDSLTVSSLALLEPAKGDTRRQPRQAEAVLLDRWRARVHEVVLDLDAGRVVRTREPEKGQPAITQREAREVGRVLEHDHRWRQALARRGLEHRDVILAAHAPGVLGEAWEASGHRFVRVVPLYRSNPFPWAAPVEGLVAVVDATNLALVEIVDAEPHPPPRPAQDPIPPLPEASLRPLRISQPDGPSFTVRGHEITWQGWSLRYALDPREGLVLYTVALGPLGGPRTPILSRASIAEMLVPYGHPSEAWAFRAVFDAGEFGLGRSAATLVAGEDVPANAVLLDAVLAGETGEPRRLADAVAVFERDGGLLWRHQQEARRGRELVVRFVTTIGSYDYGFSWVFAQDGTLAMEIDLTGVLMIKGEGDAAADSAGRFGTSLQRGISAIHHQHFFTFRLDMDVGGTANRVREIDADLLPHDASNPHGTAFGAAPTLLATERQAQRDPDPARGRIWKIESAEQADPGEPSAGYVLVPGPLPRLLASPAAQVSGRAAFTTKALWVTKYRPEERYPAGEYPGQRAGGAGLPIWTADDESIVDTDIVLWYTIGTTHFPRPEEWPRMPVARLRFELRPSGFLSPARPGRPRPR